MDFEKIIATMDNDELLELRNQITEEYDKRRKVLWDKVEAAIREYCGTFDEEITIGDLDDEDEQLIINGSSDFDTIGHIVD